MNSRDSPVLGESVSMYEGNTSMSDKGQENVEELYENILGQVKRLLAQDHCLEQLQSGGTEEKQETADENLPSRQEPFYPFSKQGNLHPLLRPPSVSLRQEAHNPVSIQEDPLEFPARSTKDTLERLRQLGVSFISPADLKSSAAPSSLPYNSVYLPQASMPSTTTFSPSPDTSLAINSLALKYLSDTQLTRLAGHHCRQGNTVADQTDKPADYTLASHQFLARHGRGENRLDRDSTGYAANLGTGHLLQGNGNIRQCCTPQHGNSQIPNTVQVRPQIHQMNQQSIRNHQFGPTQCPPPNPYIHSNTPQPRPATPELLDRVLDITAIRLQSKLL